MANRSKPRTGSGKDSCVLNVGGGPSRDLPSHFKGWRQDLLDIDAAVKPDIVCDARQLHKLKQRYDAVFCSHTLEHFYRHEVPQVISGFLHVLKSSGFVQLAVPDVLGLMECVVKGRQDIMDTWYQCPSGAISFHDVLYGWNRAMEQGNLYYAHKCGFSEASLTKALRGFAKVFTARDGMNLHAYAFKSKPTAGQLQRLGI